MVAVDDAVRVCVFQRRTNGQRDANGFVDRQLTLAIEPGAERLALHERHHIVEQPRRLARVEQRKQIRMLQVRGDPDLREKTLDSENRAELRIQHFDCDRAIVAQIARQIDGGHPAGADLAIDRVATLQGRAELGQQGHRSRVGGST
jgi:hypothetical protein